MKSIGFIVPYFTCGNGTVHSMTQLWFNSCAANPTIDWFFYTDCDLSEFNIPDNVKIYETSFDVVKNRIQKKFDFIISLESPYKLCDFKPTYGEVFYDELRNYDFWGFCDIDLIWGNIRKYITEGILENNDRILTHGHCSIFKNCDKVNIGYRTLNRMGCQDYRKVFVSPELWAFDEWSEHRGGGYTKIQKLNGIKIYDELIFADIQINRYSLHTTRELTKRLEYENKKRMRFFWLRIAQ